MPKKNRAVIAAIVHDVTQRQTFAAYADLKEAVKARCARLRVPYHAGTVAAALDLVERTRRLVVR